MQSRRPAKLVTDGSAYGEVLICCYAWEEQIQIKAEGRVQWTG